MSVGPVAGVYRAVCVRCGAIRHDYREICTSCGFRPEGEGLLIAWLLSEHNLTAEQLDVTARRVRAGEAVRPSDRMIERARVALGAHLSSDPGLSVRERVALLGTSLLLTPLVGLVLWSWWREDRPKAALQALGLSLPASLLFLGVGVWLRFLAD